MQILEVYSVLAMNRRNVHPFMVKQPIEPIMMRRFLCLEKTSSEFLKLPSISSRVEETGPRELPPFYGETTHRTHFDGKTPLPPKSFKPTYEPLQLPFEAETTSRAVYTPKAGERAKKVILATTLGTDADVKLDDMTTNRVRIHFDAEMLVG